MFDKILIANRGEIAVRVMRACREMGITPIAVYSDADRLSLHVTCADHSYHIGPPPSDQSYLNVDKIVDVARSSGADAIHPGYGFLSENPDFALACEENGITFIGPRSQTIRQMGNKLEARKAAKGAGIPVIPGTDGVVKTAKKAATVAADIGYPIMLKAAAGGGGKGLRIVTSAKDIDAAFTMTTGESTSAFGDGSVYVEKYIENPKHIEIQVLADAHGNCITLGERECSMQRRYQKVLEEAPSPLLSEKLRKEMSDAARAVSLAVGYLGAGTVEFVLDDDGRFYFLEMNTRLQVEHPVTELVYGVDIVKEQIRIAANKKLELSQSNIAMRGHSLEARIYAEDPRNNFVPSTGTIKRQILPQGPGVRNENGVYPGYQIPIHYDPLFGKVVVWGEDRTAALQRMRRALREYQVDGVKTNIEFLLWALDEKGFIDGTYDTNYIERHFSNDSLHEKTDDFQIAAIAASIRAFQKSQRTDTAAAMEYRDNVWRRVARIEGLRKPRM